MVMAESPYIVAFNVLLSTTMQLWVRFVLRTKSCLKEMKLWLEIHGSSNGFWFNLQRNSPITIDTMAYSQWINTVRIMVTKVRIIFFRSWCPASEYASRTCNPNQNVYGAYIHGAHFIILDRDRRWWSLFVVIWSETCGLVV